MILQADIVLWVAWWQQEYSLTPGIRPIFGIRETENAINFVGRTSHWFTYVRAVVARPVSLVQRDHFFPNSWVAWHRHSVTLLGGHPCKAPKHTGDMLKLARWLQTVRRNSFKSCFQQVSVLPSELVIGLASLICEGCGL